MVQRIQTAYLLLSIALLGLLFWLPFADLSAGNEIYLFSVDGISKAGEQVVNSFWLVILLAAIVLLHLFVVFSYKNRIRQIRVIVFTMVLAAGFFGLLFWYAYMGLKGATVSFRIATVFPLITLIFDYLAIRGIGKDEALIRSLNRIR